MRMRLISPMGLNAMLSLSGLVAVSQAIDLSWYPPSKTDLNNITTALTGDGVYGFIFNTSETPDDVYGSYNWCNMPHVRSTEYVKASDEYELAYVEIIQRHHKRTPYASNSFPVESYPWNCDDQGLYYYGQQLAEGSKQAANGYWHGYISPINPFVSSGWIGTCSFPQITSGGLDDSWTHGHDLYGVYHDLLGFLPNRSSEEWKSKVLYRVTNNVITSQVAGMLINGMWETTDSVPLLIQAAGIDSLEPQYSCDAGQSLSDAIKSSANADWQQHLDSSADLFAALDAISGVPNKDDDDDDSGFHVSFDHYFDNLSARQCHAKPLPCKLADGDGEDSQHNHGNPTETDDCVDQALTDAVYRMGQWEYSQIYRDASASLSASVASYGVWIAELGAHLRDVMAGKEGSPIYLHNAAHDGSVSRVLSILQVDSMVWPGMGSEIVFELYKKRGGSIRALTTGNNGTLGEDRFYVRVLFSGQTLRSSNPDLGLMDMLPVETLLAYFDGLVGDNASRVKGLCDGSIPVPEGH